MRAWIAIALMLGLAGCATMQSASSACPAGQTRLRTAQLYFGGQTADAPVVSEAEFRRFVAEEITPRFPQGLTVLDGGAQWHGQENKLIHDARKVVLIALPSDPDAQTRIEAVQGAYRTRFRLESVVKISDPACVSL
jgi:hypothetical protein